jgi:uncharacterized membrane protein YeaQ/YmgE (transglycosylase-associated protein family)
METAGTGLVTSLIIMAIAGGIIGIIARALMPGPNPMGMGMTIILGIAGSVLGGFIGRMLNLGPAGWILSIIGAMLLLWLVPKLRRAAP